jgi:5-methylcytosine-specific restriction protein A
MAVCSTAGCPNLTDRGRCPVHRRAADAQRPNSTARGYDHRWAATRAAYLAAHPWCSHPGCPLPATDVHHVDGLGPNGPAGHTWPNLAGFCRAHHSQRTARDQPGGFNAH